MLLVPARWSCRGADGTHNAAILGQPTGIARDIAGNSYLADGANHTIRRLELQRIFTCKNFGVRRLTKWNATRLDTRARNYTIQKLQN